MKDKIAFLCVVDDKSRKAIFIDGGAVFVGKNDERRRDGSGDGGLTVVAVADRLPLPSQTRE